MRLMQKSRQAFRLYDSMGRSHGGESSEFAEAQASEWRVVNGFLIKQLSLALDNPHPRALASQVFSLRRHFWDEFRGAESELHTRQKELVVVSEKGDFVRAAIVSRTLVALKARLQAAQAAHHELDDLIQKSRLSDVPIALTDDQVVNEHNHGARSAVNSGEVAESDSRSQRSGEGIPSAKIIPLRKRL